MKSGSCVPFDQFYDTYDKWISNYGMVGVTKCYPDNYFDKGDDEDDNSKQAICHISF